MANFFTVNNIYNPIRLFGIEHLSMLFLSLFLQFIVLRFIKNGNKWLCKTLSILVIIEEIIRCCWFYKSGLSNIIARGLPLWHCSVAMIFLIISSFNNNEKLLKLGSYWGFIGALCALIYPGSLLEYNYSFPHMVHLSHFSSHLYLLLVSTYNIFIRKIGMNKTDYKFALKSIIIFNTIMCIFNNMMGTNYAFVSKLLYSSYCIPSVLCLCIVTLFLWLLLSIESVLIKHNKIR